MEVLSTSDMTNITELVEDGMEVEEKLVTTLGEHSFFGEMSLLDRENISSASIRVKDFCEGWLLSVEAYHQARPTHPPFSRTHTTAPHPTPRHAHHATLTSTPRRSTPSHFISPHFIASHSTPLTPHNIPTSPHFISSHSTPPTPHKTPPHLTRPHPNAQLVAKFPTFRDYLKTVAKLRLRARKDSLTGDGGQHMARLAETFLQDLDSRATPELELSETLAPITYKPPAREEKNRPSVCSRRMSALLAQNCKGGSVNSVNRRMSNAALLNSSQCSSVAGASSAPVGQVTV